MRLARWVSRAVGRGRWLGKPAQTHLEVPWVELGGLGWVNRCREGSYGASKRDCEGDREPSREPGGQGLVGGRWMKNQMGFFFFLVFVIGLHLWHMGLPRLGGESRAAAARLHHSHSKARSELHL